MTTNSIITVTNNVNHPGLTRMINSAERFGWEIYVIETVWQGFGTKLIETYKFLLKNPDITSFVFVDAHDVVVLGSPEEFEENKYMFPFTTVSCEKACWPNADLAGDYPSRDVGEWKYLNSGLYYSESYEFIKLFDSNPPKYHDDDQLWFTEMYLSGGHIIRDYNCNLFQSYSHIHDGDFEYTRDRLINLKTGTTPIFVHGNGRTDMSLVDNLLQWKK